ncbi:hypothetical protein HOS59_gp52 [Streptomyces phage Rowa]|uniref:Lipoprotein n=1 Tax=Streptomyces phage Rowa TaxID=2059883 RepID=A0A2H5BLV6_9CAUD|nr:hypothetical protein HOS59_gp52 [Streptomyces phage Rowa]AUG87316.1 hypothetical protein SEA_ROWA_52 [Streptomyces phage Rowa]
MNVRAVVVSVLVGGTACLSAAVIAASPAEAPTLSDCRGMCPVVTQTPLDRPLSHTDRVGPRTTLKP